MLHHAGPRARCDLLDQLVVEAGAFYLLDRGYLDFARLYRLHQAQGFFVTRAKRNFRFRYLESRPVDRTTGVYSDQTIRLSASTASGATPNASAGSGSSMPRRQVARVPHQQLRPPPLTIAQLYKCRWQVELFFKWLKQHLRIKAFYGTSENAVKTQIWTAIAVYVLVAIVKKRLHLEASLYAILQILSVSLFEKIPLVEALTLSHGLGWRTIPVTN